MDSTLPIPQIPASAARRAANRGFMLVVWVSCIVHVGIFVGVIWQQSRRPHRPEPTRAIPVELVRLGKKRDPALLPRKVEPVYSPPPAPEAINLDTNNKATPASKKEKTAPKEMSEAAKRLLAGADSKLEKALSKIDEPEGDPDGDPLGTTTEANAAQGYAAVILRTLRANYHVSETIPSGQRQFLKARVVLYVERDGRIREFHFIEEHPNKVFMGGLDTMLKTLQLPAPPKELAATMRDTGIEVVFKP